jgi:transcriptional regulator GlxA family with amidase domain
MIVAVLGLPRVMGFELLTPGQVFGMANVALAEEGGPPRYDVRICALTRTVTTMSEMGEVKIIASHGMDALAEADVIVVPGTADFLTYNHAVVADQLCAAVDRGARVASVCVGAFTLAAAGLLAGRRATTHWRWSGELARRYPDVRVDDSALFIDEGHVLTAGGIASGLDLCLHLIRQDGGAELAAKTARRLVIPAWRDEGQAPHIEHLPPARPEQPLQATIEWMKSHAQEPLDLNTIARQASMSARSLNRQFRIQFDTTPMQLLLQIRIDLARTLLETTELPMARVAEESGLGSHALLRYHFARTVGMPPHRYRANYRSGRETAGSAN